MEFNYSENISCIKKKRKENKFYLSLNKNISSNKNGGIVYI